MAIFLIIISILCWAASIWCLFARQIIAPALSYLGLLLLSFAKVDVYPLLPINNVMLIGWLSMTVVVMIATILQPDRIVRQTKGMAFIVIGGIVGLAVGLLGFTVESAALRYSIMIISVVAGIFFGFLLYSNTPDGQPVRIGSGNFFKYLLAKGFPTAITLMQPGVVLVLLISIKNVNGL